MSNRLESLNPKKPAAKPGLKFKPKAVARKSKEDRDREAPEIKQETSQRAQNASRGRGSARGRGRGRGGAYVGTHVVLAGPLAMGSVGVGGGTTSSKTGLTNDRIYGAGDSASVAPLASLKRKARDDTVKKLDGATASDSEDEDDPTKINMNKEYAFDDTETVLFPVRPQKSVAPNSAPELVSEYTPLPLASASAAASETPNPRAQTIDSVKSEEFDGVATEDPENDISPSAPLLVNPDEKQEADEHDRIIDDQKLIVDMLTHDFGAMKTDDEAQNNAYVLVHVPQITPTENVAAAVCGPASKSHYALPIAPNFEGQVGSLNFHQLGKITMTLGQGSVFQCAGGNPSSFLQELYIIENSEADINPEEPEEETASVLDADGKKIAGRIYRLGDISGKIVATPAIQ